jgi:fatty-acyl-CoA synthase
MKPGRTSLDASVVRAHCIGRLAHYKIPRYVVVVEEFPMTVTGKVRKIEIRERSIELLGLVDEP